MTGTENRAERAQRPTPSRRYREHAPQALRLALARWREREPVWAREELKFPARCGTLSSLRHLPTERSRSRWANQESSHGK
jgi:hypothetical protein